MSTLVLDFWNCVPEEILAHVFSYLPFEDRHTAFSVCQSWVKAVSVPSVWSFTEIRCNTEGMDNGCMLERLHQYLCHIKHLKIILDQCQERFRRQVTQILDKLTQKSYMLQALCIVYCGESPYAYSGPDILYSFRLFLRRGNLDLQYIDFRQTSFMLDSETVQLTATSSPNLHTLFINNYACRVTVLKPETIIEVLRTCPKLSSLGVHQATLSEDVLQELLEPSRGPFLFLDIFCDGLDHDIPEELWSALTEKHPQLRVGLELSFLVTPWQIPPILKPNIPVAAMQFNTFIYMARQIRFVTANYSRTLEKLVLDTNPSNALSLALIEMARTCVHLKEIHCSCTVSQGVRDAFLSNCPALIRYTLSTH